ncbi:predicted protein [Sclerotinia sclerotiorum 1980 UF-70]|uniref:Uncharacterized protein n=1 Tax=Sclerotinia sclerotiorum (strain ATCC 18683 / 1980 / Ss-1) TaxID=665079 RepID=A7F2L5_SCLS1|nr:predicted protein [Sclerotinia sclerotiorum 1980 UF-70]EDN95957.1 predicted protein [Sclerotinia sclerotiorum 1980 UF-70]
MGPSNDDAIDRLDTICQEGFIILSSGNLIAVKPQYETMSALVDRLKSKSD